MKLLHKTLQVYLLFSILIFLASIPVFYLVIRKLWIQDMDETLMFQKTKFLKGVEAARLDSAEVFDFSELASKFDLGIIAIANPANFKPGDSIYFHSYYDKVHGHIEPFRELSSDLFLDDRPYRLIIRKDMVENEDLISAILYMQAAIFLLFLIGLVVLNNYYSKKLWRPFYHIVDHLKSFNITGGTPVLGSKSHILEFNALNESVEKLTKNNIEVYKAQKEYTENAAHETQTPLAVIRNQVDLLAQSAELSFVQSEIITKIDKNLRLLSKLNRSLLILSKIENHQFDEKESVNITSLLTEVTESFAEQIKLKGIILTIESQNSLSILSNSYLLTLLFTNLLSNSVKYNAVKGKITIKLTENHFEIWNTGSTKALPEDKIFRRFYKASEQSDGAGLGLAIAKQISDLLNLNLQYDFVSANQHHFKISFRL